MFSRNFEEVPNEIKNKTFVVGGAVRDRLRGDQPQDFDFVVENTNPETLKTLGFKEVGETHMPVFLHPETGDEFALGRKETKTGTGYKGFDFDLNQPLEVDLKRRDLTINSIAFDINNNEIIDPFNGKDDLNNQVLRHTSEAFKQDPVRVLRLARFASRLPNFDIASETIALAQDVVNELNDEPNERIGKEVKKTFKEAESPRRFFDIAKKVNALKIIAPQIAKLDNVPAGPDRHHNEGSALEHTLQVIEQFNNIDPNNLRGLISCLAHDLGKINTNKENLPNHHGHGKRGVDLVGKLKENLKLSNELEGCMKTACEQHMRVRNVLSMSDSKIIRLVKSLQSGKSLSIDELVNVAKADSLGREPSRVTEDIDGIRTRLKTALRVLENFDGNEVVENNPDKSGKQLGQLIEQRQIENLRELI